MSSFNVTDSARAQARCGQMQKNLRRAETSPSCSSVSSGQAGPAQPQDAYEKAPVKGADTAASSSSSVSLKEPARAPEKAPAKGEGSRSSSVSFEPPPNKAPIKRSDSSSSSACAVQQQDGKAPVGKGDQEGQVGPRGPGLDPSTYHKQLVDCIQTGDEYGPHHSCYKAFREIARKLIKAHGRERDYDAILYPLDLRHRKYRTESECNRIDAARQDQQNQQESGKWVTVDRSPGGAVNLWAKAVYVETHGWKLKCRADRRSAYELILSTCTLVEQADVNMSDHALRLKVRSGGLHRHLRHLDKKLHTRKAAKAAERATENGDASPQKAPAKKGLFSWFKRK